MQPLMQRRDVLASAAMLVATYTGASVLAYLHRAWYLDSLLPAIGVVIDRLLPQEVERAALTIVGDQTQIMLEATLLQPLQIGREFVPYGEVVSTSTLGGYALHHVAIILAVLVAWPARTLVQRATLLALAPPTILLATLLDIPFVLAGLVHQLFLDVGVRDFASPSLAVYYEFVHRGGRAGLSISLAFAAGFSVQACKNLSSVSHFSEVCVRQTIGHAQNAR